MRTAGRGDGRTARDSETNPGEHKQAKGTHTAGEEEVLKALKEAKTLDPSIHLEETQMQVLKPAMDKERNQAWI